MPAGLVDAGASSLATFVAGVAAARLLDPAVLGGYAVLFSVWVFTQQIPLQLILVPAEARLAAVDVGRRAGALGRNLALAAPFSVFAAVLTVAAVAFVPAEVGSGPALRLAVTAGAVAALFPLQQHVRSLLHLARRHWAAASMSAIRLVVTSVLILAGWSSGVDPAFVPFGALAVGDAVTVAAALLLTRSAPSASGGRVRTLVAAGRWLLVGMSLPPAAGVLVNVAVAHLAGSDTLGFAEAARVVAQPVLVAATGLAAVLRPSSMEAAVAFDGRRARRVSRRFTLLMAAIALAYLLWTVTPAPFNVLRLLVPVGFSVPGLVAASVVAAFANGLSPLYVSELVAADRARGVAVTQFAAAAARSVTTAAVTALGAFTVPVAAAAAGATRVGFALRILRHTYRRAVGD